MTNYDKTFIMLIIFSLLFLFGVLIASQIANAWSVDNPAHIEEYIYYLSAKEQINVSKVLAIARCESKINKDAIGDNGKSFGVFQIHLPSHPTITKEQALNPWFNISWSIDRMKEGKWKMWSCYKTVAQTVVI